MLIESNPYVPYWHLSVETLILVISVLLIWLLTSFLGVTYGLTGGLFVLFGTAFAGFSMIQRGILVDVSWSLVSQFVTASISFYLNFREQNKLRLQIKKQFEHYLDPRQVKRLQQNPDTLKLGGEKKYCTYLFTDVRGFTPLTEKLKPEEVTYIMNRVLTIQADAVKKHDGMVDKYIGDAMMAVFGAPLTISEPENKAIETMIDILDGVKLLNHQLKSEGLPSIKIGVGINSGEAIIGNMGSETRFDYTCIGDSVNVAARLESNTKELEVSNLIGESTARNCEYSLKELDAIVVKGKSKKLRIFTWSFDE
jgi:adenylate cyclase